MSSSPVSSGAVAPAASPSSAADDHPLSVGIDTSPSRLEASRFDFNGAPRDGVSTVRLRRIEPNESSDVLAAVREVVLEYIAGLGIDMAFQDVSSEVADLPGEKYTTAGNGVFYVIEDVDGTEAAVAAAAPGTSVSPVLVGCVALKDLGSGVCETKRLFIRSAWRGRDLGRLLLVHLIDAATRAGFDTMKLDTLARFDAANTLYERLGFASCEPYNYNPQPDVRYFVLEGLQAGAFVVGREDAYSRQPRGRKPAAAAASQ